MESGGVYVIAHDQLHYFYQHKGLLQNEEWIAIDYKITPHRRTSQQDRKITLHRYNFVLDREIQQMLEPVALPYWFYGTYAQIALSRDGRWLAVSLPSGNDITYVWSLASGRLIHQFYGGSVLTFSPDGNQLALADAQSIRIFTIGEKP
jgi:hypothetical protein